MWARIRDLLHGVGVEVAAACPSKVNWPWRCANWCTPRTNNGGYAAEKTRYSAAALRAYTVLIETSDSKNPHASTCTPRTNNGGYAAEKTHYSAAALRAYTVLIETSDSKNPHASTQAWRASCSRSRELVQRAGRDLS